jgi:hypothetical protein
MTEEKMEDLYCPNAIGFLATEENLNDEKFTRYIKELYARFFQVTFKVFYFSDMQKRLAEEIFYNEIGRFKMIIATNIYDFSKEIEIYIRNADRENSNIHDLLMLNNYKIFNLYWSVGQDGILIKEMDRKNYEAKHLFLQKPELFGFTKEDVEKVNFSLYRLISNKILTKLLKQDFNLNISQPRNTFLFYEQIEYILCYEEYKEHLINLARKQKMFNL